MRAKKIVDIDITPLGFGKEGNLDNNVRGSVNHMVGVDGIIIIYENPVSSVHEDLYS